MRRHGQALLRVDLTQDPERQFTARYIMGTCLAVGAWTALVAMAAVDTSPSLRATNACLSVIFLGTYWVCRDGRVEFALRLYVGAVLLGGTALILFQGTRISTLPSLCAIPLAAAVFVRPRAIIYILVLLVAGIVGVDWAIEQDIYVPTELREPLSWKPTARQLIFVPLMATVLRWGYDGVNRKLLRRTGRARAASDAAEDRMRTLESEVEERTASLAARTELRQSVAVAFADELDQPLERMAASLRELSDGADDEQRRRLQPLSRAADAAERMQLMVCRLLEHARLGNDATLDEAVELAAMVASIVEEASVEAPNVAWQLDSLPALVGDGALIRAALENLVSNAIKFSREQDSPAIHIGYSSAERAIFVRDNGVGFDTRYVSKLFQPFQRVHGRQFEGVGVGLANVRRCAELHGGRVWAEATVGAGATFFVCFTSETKA